MKALLIVMGALAIAGLAAVFLFIQIFSSFVSGVSDGFAGTEGDGTHTGPQPVHFLQTDGFDPMAPGAAVVLHPAITGLPDPVAVTDPQAIHAAAEQAFFTDDQRAEGRLVLLSILFLSPPTNGTRATMVSLFQDGQEVATLTCYTGQCPRGGPPTAPFELAALDTTAQPVRLELETITGTAAAHAFEAELRSRPGHFIAHGLEGLPDPAQSFDGSLWVQLPSTFGPWGETTDYLAEAEQAALDATLTNLRDTLPFEIAIDISSTRAEWTPYQIIELATDRQATGENGYLATDGYLPHLRPEARIWVDSEHVPALRRAIEAADWPTPAPPPPDEMLATRLPQALAANGIQGAPEDYMHRVEIYSLRETLRIGTFTEPDVQFGYYVVQE